MSKKEPKTVLDKIAFIITTQNTPGGSSRPAITKGMKEKFGETAPAAMKAALKKGVEKAVLVQSGQKFWLAGREPPAAPAEPTVDIVELEEGTGATAERGRTCTMSYQGTLQEDGSQFDSASKFSFTLGAGEVIKGWETGVAGMRVGGRRRLTVPPKLGYGKRGSPPEIPGDATLCFNIKLLAVK